MTGRGQLLIFILVIVCLKEGLGQLATWKKEDQIIGAAGYPVKM